MHVGMAPARLAWALLPLLAGRRSLPWIDGAGGLPRPRAFVPLRAADRAHASRAPARRGRRSLALAALRAGTDAARIGRAPLRWLVVARAAHGVLDGAAARPPADTRALAWGTLTPPSLGQASARHPLVDRAGDPRRDRRRRRTSRRERAARAAGRGRSRSWSPSTRSSLEPLGVRWLPADRVAGRLLAGPRARGRPRRRTAARRLRRSPGPRCPRRASAPWCVAVVASSLAGRRDADAVAAARRLAVLRGDRARAAARRRSGRRCARRPPGACCSCARACRSCSARSGGARTPTSPRSPRCAAGRAIVNGTFTHPSPVAALVYRGDAGPAPITQLVEQLDGRSLFGQPARRRSTRTTFDALRATARRERRRGAGRGRAPPAALADNPRRSLPSRGAPPFLDLARATDQRAAPPRTRALARAGRTERTAGHRTAWPTTRSGARPPAANPFPRAAAPPASWRSSSRPARGVDLSYRPGGSSGPASALTALGLGVWCWGRGRPPMPAAALETHRQPSRPSILAVHGGGAASAHC